MTTYIPREISGCIKETMKMYPVVTLTGPRQSGKSTLLKHLFPEFAYVSMEDPDIRAIALNDPRRFLETYSENVIIDEAQKTPEIFSYLQTHVDKTDKTGMYILSGSHNFLLLQDLSQSLAGRTAVLNLLPLSRKELNASNLLDTDIDYQIHKGFYPRIYNKNIPPERYYSDYVQTYVERDVRNVLRVADLNKFIRFLRLIACRIGQLINLTSLATEAGMATSTVENWLSVLEASFICYRLEPYFNNFNKRITKSPKLYFYDTGLASYLIGLNTAEEVGTSYLRGQLFENLVINQFLKDCLNRGKRPELSFWRDSQGNEVDLLVGTGENIQAYEIKSGATFSSTYFKGLKYWSKISGTSTDRLNVIYTGETTLETTEGKLLSFPHLF